MKKYVDGRYVEVTQEELAARLLAEDTTAYKDRVVNRIRERYSVDDEIAILRQKDTKAEEFQAYNDFVERIKQEEKSK